MNERAIISEEFAAGGHRARLKVTVHDHVIVGSKGRTIMQAMGLI